MGILADHQIKKLAMEGMITPFYEAQSQPGVISYGLSCYGYDVRLGSHFKVFDSWLKGHNKVIDPKTKDWHDSFTDMSRDYGDCIIIPPHSFCLAESVEEFNIPRNIMVLCVGKSSLARCGIICNVTPGEPEWIGRWTIEISNTTPLPAKIYAGEGIFQALFFVGDEVCTTSYKDKRGKYQHQTGLTMPSVNK